jgi:hypothetical protein
MVGGYATAINDARWLPRLLYHDVGCEIDLWDTVSDRLRIR